MPNCRLPLVIGLWQHGRHENIYRIDRNRVRGSCRDFFICTNPVRITDWWHKRGHYCNWPAKPPGDDEADDGNVEDDAIKLWMNPDPNAPPQQSKGTATRKSIMGGRYSVMDVTGKMQMPGEDGKPKDMQFKGMGIEGYDNAKKKFVSSWIDNMSTGIQFSEGTYDPATKTFTYTSEIEMIPGMKTPVREVIKATDKDHMVLEWYENRGGQEKKTMEINYTRAGKK